MSGPQRIQRQRTKGWRMPEGAVYVGRPSKWGNPYEVVNGHKQGWLIYDSREPGSGFIRAFQTKPEALKEAVKLYRRFMYRQINMTEIRGRDLACWCPLDQSCHADVLLKLSQR